MSRRTLHLLVVGIAWTLLLNSTEAHAIIMIPVGAPGTGPVPVDDDGDGSFDEDDFGDGDEDAPQDNCDDEDPPGTRLFYNFDPTFFPLCGAATQGTGLQAGLSGTGVVAARTERLGPDDGLQVIEYNLTITKTIADVNPAGTNVWSLGTAVGDILYQSVFGVTGAPKKYTAFADLQGQVIIGNPLATVRVVWNPDATPIGPLGAPIPNGAASPNCGDYDSGIFNVNTFIDVSRGPDGPVTVASVTLTQCFDVLIDMSQAPLGTQVLLDFQGSADDAFVGAPEPSMAVLWGAAWAAVAAARRQRRRARAAS